MTPQTRYAVRDGDHIAYQVVGSGPLDVVYLSNWFGHVDGRWEEPTFAAFLERLASFARLILFDKRGAGASDPLPLDNGTTWEAWLDDITTVLDAVGSDRAAFIGVGDGGPATMLFAATYPDRTAAIALFNTFARMIQADDYPCGVPAKQVDEIVERVGSAWGSGALVESFYPSRARDEAFRQWWAKYQRMSSNRVTAKQMARMAMTIDARSVLPSIAVPTLVMHRRDFKPCPIELGRFLADHIAGARFIELGGADGPIFTQGDTDCILAEMQEFFTGVRPAPSVDRVLATVLFTDIVDSTPRALSLGDKTWRELLVAHHAIVRRELVAHRGREIDTAGDGFFATFDGPARAIKCACAIRDAVRDLGIEIRAGLHTGEVELSGDKVSGISVHIGARVAGAARPSEVLVSRTVADLVAGSDIRLDDRGEFTLKGVPGMWRLLAVAA